MDVIVTIIPLALANMAPLLIIALGGLYSERSGVVNIALEGLLGIGAFVSALVIYMTSGELGYFAVWLGLISGAAAGGLFSLLHAFASVTMRADQVVSGTAINLLSCSLTVYLARVIMGNSNIQIHGFSKSNVPVLSEVPILGLFFRNFYITTFLVVLIVIFSWFILYKRPFGLHLRACGENPHAADSMGINVKKMRYTGVFISGVLAGLGGAIVITTYSWEFSPNIYSGLGFLALAALIFGKWKPLGVFGAAAFFGLAKTVAEISKLFDPIESLPNIFFNTFPYVVTLIALVLFSRNSAGPKAAGEPYDAGKR
ncbi:MAG TPA: ABC transporter permease [Ruminiclostridium sp.]|nr:ABC transporter permease [Ruminiclostridium sp.]